MLFLLFRTAWRLKGERASADRLRVAPDPSGDRLGLAVCSLPFSFRRLDAVGVGEPEEDRAPVAARTEGGMTGLLGVLESDGGVFEEAGAGQKERRVGGSRSTCMGRSQRLLVGSDEVIRTIPER